MGSLFGASVRPPAVAGTFYPAQPSELRHLLESLLASARSEPPVPGSPGHAPPPDAAASLRDPKALIAPHAGYVYSGPTAARAYARIAPMAEKIRRVVLAGPLHRAAVRGIAVPAVDRFSTPLGDVPIDTEAIAALRALPQVVVSTLAHAPEHSLEVHLPFLQHVLRQFSLVPLGVGDASAADVAGVLDRVWGGDETLIVISTDLSHYLPYEQACRVDRATVASMLALDADIDHRHACGATPVDALMQVARRRGLKAELLDLRNSGDTAGSRDRVVGYAAIALHEPGHAPVRSEGGDAMSCEAAGAGLQPDAAAGKALLSHARAAVAEALGLPAPPVTDAPILHACGATFVTLSTGPVLRGCVGTLSPHRTLEADVRANAVAAARSDPRFPPLLAAEYPHLAISVSLLSPSQTLDVASESELLARLRPGVDGVTLCWRDHRATFLPQVWEHLPEPRDFIAHLRRKARLRRNLWPPDLQVSRYTVTRWSDSTERSIQ